MKILYCRRERKKANFSFIALKGISFYFLVYSKILTRFHGPSELLAFVMLNAPIKKLRVANFPNVTPFSKFNLENETD